MKGIIITSDNCEPCVALKEQFKTELESGEITEVNVEKEPAKVLEIMEKHGIGIPSLLILSDKDELIVSI